MILEKYLSKNQVAKLDQPFYGNDEYKEDSRNFLGDIENIQDSQTFLNQLNFQSFKQDFYNRNRNA